MKDYDNIKRVVCKKNKHNNATPFKCKLDTDQVNTSGWLQINDFSFRVDDLDIDADDPSEIGILPQKRFNCTVNKNKKLRCEED